MHIKDNQKMSGKGKENEEQTQPQLRAKRKVVLVRDSVAKLGSLESVQQMTRSLKRKSERIAAERAVAENMFIDTQVCTWLRLFDQVRFSYG